MFLNSTILSTEFELIFCTEAWADWAGWEGWAGWEDWVDWEGWADGLSCDLCFFIKSKAISFVIILASTSKLLISIWLLSR